MRASVQVMVLSWPGSAGWDRPYLAAAPSALPLDIHLDGLRRLGAQIEEVEGESSPVRKC